MTEMAKMATTKRRKDPLLFLRWIVPLIVLCMGPCHGQQQQQQQQHQDVVIDPIGNIQNNNNNNNAMKEDTKTDINGNNDAKLHQHFGVDHSWPIHHQFDDKDKVGGGGGDNEGDILDHQRRYMAYQQYMNGCQSQSETASTNNCLGFELDRIEMNLQQPKAMENYTHAGYAKVYTPSNVQSILSELWHTHNHEAEIELWDPSNTYVNHWSVPTKMLDIKQYLTEIQIQQIINDVQPILEAWTKQSLTLTSIYGIRSYQKGAILAPHVDRLPLVTSCIIHVASSSSSSSSEDGESNNSNKNNNINPWVLEVIDHDGVAHNVTMDVGDMILYESHTIIHGRPYPLESDYYANIFIHFEPIGHTIRHAQKGAYGADVLGQQDDSSSPQQSYQLALSKATKRYEQQQQQFHKKQQQEKIQQQEELKKQQLEINNEIVVIDANFDIFDTSNIVDTFMYRDDVFYRTNNPAFAKGEYVMKVWTGSPGLQIKLGQKGDPPVRGISGGWTTSFTLNTKFTTLKVKFDYQLQISKSLLQDEYGQLIVTFDSTRQKNVATLVGDNPSNAVTSGTSEIYWHNIQPGQHTITIGAYNNKKTYNDEWVQAQIDNVVITVSQQHSQAQSRSLRDVGSSSSRSGSAAASSASEPTNPPSMIPDLPHYVQPTLATQWKQQFEYQRNQEISPKPTRQTLGLLTAHLAAADGLLDALKEISAKDRNQLFKGDVNGWRPLHEAARSGHTDVVEYLLKEGAQVNERTNHGKGGNALWWAEKKQTKQHKETAAILKKYGAVKLAPKND